MSIFLRIPFPVLGVLGLFVDDGTLFDFRDAVISLASVAGTFRITNHIHRRLKPIHHLFQVLKQPFDETKQRLSLQLTGLLFDKQTDGFSRSIVPSSNCGPYPTQHNKVRSTLTRAHPEKPYIK